MRELRVSAGGIRLSPSSAAAIIRRTPHILLNEPRLPRSIKAFIYPDAVSQNLDAIKQRASTSRVWAVLKANAYGHGIERIYSALDAADGIALLDLDEAVRTRQLRWKEPILLLEGIFSKDDVRVAEAFVLTVVVHCDEQRHLIACAKPTRPIDIYLKMNSGMNCLGYSPERFRDAWLRASDSSTIGSISLMSHFANADEGDVEWQMARFDEATRNLPCGYADGYPRHALSGTPVAVYGVLTQPVGRVSMDMLTVDLTPCPQAGVGSKVELWREQVKIDDVARLAATIGYELMYALARRVPVTVTTEPAD